MQDLRTGELRALPPDFAKLVAEMPKSADAIQQMKDAVIPNRADQGPVFSVGEEVSVKGGRFKVHAIQGRRLYLDSLARQ